MWAHLKSVEGALEQGDTRLAQRLLSKALEQVQCMYCHGPLDYLDQPYHEHFKGYRHDECAEAYQGRSDYLRQHPDAL